jgi:hypothetical protein
MQKSEVAMKITIEGDLDQIVDAMGLPAPKGPKSLRRAENEARQKTLLEKRRLIRNAFEKVRYTKEGRAAVLLRALTTVNGLTEAAVETAREVIDRPTQERG